MIKADVRTYQWHELVCGLKADKVAFDHKPYAKRTPEAQAAYQRLRNDLIMHGMNDPLITWKGHVLIGMRRYEIMCELGAVAFRCYEVLEDVELWTRDDIERLQQFKEAAYGMSVIQRWSA